jgi:Response regulator containing CheY-like receiver, AAA-type ATPase, and DNA-binding domains
MSDQIRVLAIEDVEADVELALHELKRSGLRCEGRCVETEDDFRRALDDFRPDVILSDFSMPHFDGMTALAIAVSCTPRSRSSSCRAPSARNTPFAP